MNKKTGKPARAYKTKKASSKSTSNRTRAMRSTAAGTRSGFASTQKYVTAVEQIYLEEINDIERFVKFIE